MISVQLYSGADGVTSDVDLADVASILRRDDALLWLDVVALSADDFHFLTETFGFHPLAIDDTKRQHKRPKLDLYDDYIFLVFYGADQAHGHFAPCEVDLFASKQYVVTIHDGTLSAIAEATERWRRNAANADESTMGFLLYTILDTIVDDYFPIIDRLGERVDTIEDNVLDRATQAGQRGLLRLQKDLAKIRRLIEPERDALQQLVAPESAIYSDDTAPYFEALQDHLLRLGDAIHLQQDQLNNALDVSLSMTSNHLNEVVKRLTAWSIILMGVTLVASIYGMNFVFMPELDWYLGYPFALGMMLLITGVLAILFRRIDWW